MNKFLIITGLIIFLLCIFLFTTKEFNKPIIVPSYVPFIPSQKGASRGGELMFEFSNLNTPGWKWGDCCSGGTGPSGVL